MSYEKSLNKFFREKKKNTIQFKKISQAEREYEKTKFEKPLNKKEISKSKRKMKIGKDLKYIEITSEHFTVYNNQDKTKVLLQVKRLNLENINTQIEQIIEENKINKNKLLRIKYEILFELFDLDKGSEKVQEIEDLENLINKGDKLLNKLNMKKNEKKNSIKEKINSINLRISEMKAMAEENRERHNTEKDKSEYLKNYYILSKEKQTLYDLLLQDDIIETEILNNIKNADLKNEENIEKTEEVNE